MKIKMCMPFLGVNVNFEEVDCANGVLNLSEKINKKLIFFDDSNNFRECNFTCGKAYCDGSCDKLITLSESYTGKIKITYL